jgi:hypothetical protein
MRPEQAALQGLIRPYKGFSDLTKVCKASENICKALQGFIKPYKALWGLVVRCQVSEGITGLCKVP